MKLSITLLHIVHKIKENEQVLLHQGCVNPKKREGASNTTSCTCALEGKTLSKVLPAPLHDLDFQCTLQLCAAVNSVDSTVHICTVCLMRVHRHIFLELCCGHKQISSTSIRKNPEVYQRLNSSQ